MAVDALSVERALVGHAFSGPAGEPVLRIGRHRFRFGTDRRSWLLAWERLVDALPHFAEEGRIRSMHHLVGVAFPAPWSVYTTAVTAAWLRHSRGGVGTSAWVKDTALIGAVAGQDGTLTLKSLGEGESHLVATFRRRELIGRLQLSRGVSYLSATRTLAAHGVIPETVAAAVRGRSLAGIVEAPWLGKAAKVAEAIVLAEGSAFRLDEELVSLEPVPDAALAAPGLRGPSHAPWLLAADEHAALDVVDALAHRNL